MILSHEHKFIFIKTEKTAGTSVEIALSKYCGPSDIITPISSRDEETRRELGYRGPQNYRVALAKYTKRDWLDAIRNRRPVRYRNHVSATFVCRHIEPEIWRSYFKFCFERNPWDKAISFYYWKYPREPRPSISEFIQSGVANRVRGFDLYSEQGEIIVDRVFKFEELREAMSEIGQQFGLDETPILPRAKLGVRQDPRNYRDILTIEDREKIARVFAREIAYFGYAW